ncbi:unnamed protein product [Ranitomeya imitator]|uniref:Uncharacterized protein n=1 Tax=Ranitomeya imitator TaxID=111125 RepID=A0ABN9LSV9_9NEOB|nr:unnamed protein product [Ranitomeya imitator]
MAELIDLKPDQVKALKKQGKVKKKMSSVEFRDEDESEVRKLIPELRSTVSPVKGKKPLISYETSSNDAEIIVKKRRLVPETFLSYMRNREPEPSTLEVRNNSNLTCFFR